jgi:hypothetical protein
VTPFPFDPSPSTLWTLQRDGTVASCCVRFAPIGTEVRMFRNESLLMSQVFPSGDEALAWAEEERLFLGMDIISVFTEHGRYIPRRLRNPANFVSHLSIETISTSPYPGGTGSLVDVSIGADLALKRMTCLVSVWHGRQTVPPRTRPSLRLPQGVLSPIHRLSSTSAFLRRMSQAKNSARRRP